MVSPIHVQPTKRAAEAAPPLFLLELIKRSLVGAVQLALCRRNRSARQYRPTNLLKAFVGYDHAGFNHSINLAALRDLRLTASENQMRDATQRTNSIGIKT
jgi:hypothetical protein